MTKLTRQIEKALEKLSEVSQRVLASPLMIVLVLVIVVVWFGLTLFSDTDLMMKMRDWFIGISFLTFFIVQRALHKFNLALHVKLDELVRSHENASNELINVEQKTVKEIEEISKTTAQEK